jgi:UDP-2,3-diacylglucosamine pyrophosphatase LpxH
MAVSIPNYIELYSISDLHLGGVLPSGQIFRQGERARLFIESLALRQGPFALVLAGDLFDSLPYLTGTGSYIAIDGAAEILKTVIDTPAFTPVFTGLRTFLQQDGRELIILIGNHDLEIALPETQEELLRHIAPTAAARGRVRFSTNGVGFRCRVGDRNVFITHGNETDPWNHVDHEALRRVAHARGLGQTFNPRHWVPNAGTKLVIDVMNTIKEKHPFIDLLKPERKAAVKTLRVLAPATLASFFDAIPAFADAAWAHTGPHVVLGAGRKVAVSEPEIIRLLNEASRVALDTEPPGTAVMDRVEQFAAERKRPVDLVAASDDSTLGYIFDRFVRGLSPSQALSKALQEWTEEDQSFNLEDRDSTFRGVLSQVGSGVDVVITGHTHLPRWIRAREKNLVYLNAGAWARVIGLRKEFFASDPAFQPVYDALVSTQLADLDNATVPAGGEDVPLVLDATVAAHVAADGRIAELVRVTHRGAAVDELPVDPTQSVLEWR